MEMIEGCQIKQHLTYNYEIFDRLRPVYCLFLSLECIALNAINSIKECYVCTVEDERFHYFENAMTCDFFAS